jgi:hypothetical protein
MATNPRWHNSQIDAAEQLLAAVRDVALDELPHLLGQLREIEATALARLYTSPASGLPSTKQEELLNITEAAKRLNVSEDYLYRNWKKLPFARKYGWGLRFNALGINHYIQSSHLDGQGVAIYTARSKKGATL